jgi:hypothetical protein
MKKAITFIFASITILIGLSLLIRNPWPSDPSLIGLALVLVGYLHFMPFCPICKMICKE